MLLGQAEEDYIKLILKLQRFHERVTLRMVAGRLGVSAPAVTKMVRKLTRKELVSFERSRGVRLTGSGKEAALGVVRGHRLIELFLHDYLGYTWDEVHEEAEQLEHVVSERFKEKLADRMNNPTHDPHGDPIPDSQLRLPVRSEITLFEVENGYSGMVSRVRDDDPKELQALARLGLFPGTSLSRISEQKDGTIEISRHDGSRLFIPLKLARSILMTEKETDQ